VRPRAGTEAPRQHPHVRLMSYEMIGHGVLARCPLASGSAGSGRAPTSLALTSPF